MHSRYWPRLRASGMSVLGGGLNRSTQHSISFSLLGFESQGLAHAASDPKVSVFSAAVKPRRYPRRSVIHSIFPPFRIECCVDRLSWQHKADFTFGAWNVRIWGMVLQNSSLHCESVTIESA